MPSVPPPSSDIQDDEEFCSDCFAGLTSSQHHEECIAPLDQLEDGAA